MLEQATPSSRFGLSRGVGAKRGSGTAGAAQNEGELVSQVHTLEQSIALGERGFFSRFCEQKRGFASSIRILSLSRT